MLWAAIAIASLSWVFAFHLYISPDPFLQWTMIGAAILTASIAFNRVNTPVRLSGRYLLLLIPILAAAWIATPDAGPGMRINHFNPWYAAALRLASSPYRPALILVPVGIITTFVASRTRVLAFLVPACRAILLVGGVLVVQSPLFWLTTAWMARNPEMPVVASIIYPVLKWLGTDASFHNGVLYIRMMRDTHEFPLTWVHLDLFSVLNLWLGGAVLLALDRARRPLRLSLPAFSALLLAYALCRLVVMLVVFVNANLFVEHESEIVHVEVFWLPWIAALSFLPLILILATLLPWRDGPPVGIVATALPWERSDHRPRILALLALACAAFVVGNNYWDPGIPKQGRVLLDEAHSQWERTDKPYDTDWYGHESGYNYYCMAQYLRHFYQLDFNMDGELTPERLAQYDVLILKTPTELYSPKELDAIESFVKNGGGVFALGEHTNVFGSSTCLNPVTRRFGLAFRYDVVFDIQRKWEQTHFPTRLGRHPAMAAVPFFRFAVSCSVESDTWRSQPVMRSTGLWSLPIDYCPSNFYPSVRDHSYAKFGAFDQMLTTKFGRGRVAAFGDSTVYSNFLAFYPGKPELLLGTVNWLNRANRWDWLNGVALAFAVLAGAAAIMFAFRARPDLRFFVAAVCIGCGTSWSALALLDRLAQRAYATPTPHTPVKQVVFELQHGDYELPIFSFAQNFAKSYEVFYQYVLRLGYYTTAGFDLAKAARGMDPIIVIRPVRPFSAVEIDAVGRFLKAGGSMLVLDSPTNAKSTANELLRPFGLSFATGACRGTTLVEPASSATICRTPAAMAVAGGTPLLRTDHDETVLAVARVERGQIIAAGLSDRFCDIQMGGGSRTIPNRDLRATYELEFELLHGVVEGNAETAIHRLGQTYAEAATKPASVD